jgi:hypothetical protein
MNTLAYPCFRQIHIWHTCVTSRLAYVTELKVWQLSLEGRGDWPCDCTKRTTEGSPPYRWFNTQLSNGFRRNLVLGGLHQRCRDNLVLVLLSPLPCMKRNANKYGIAEAYRKIIFIQDIIQNTLHLIEIRNLFIYFMAFLNPSSQIPGEYFKLSPESYLLPVISNSLLTIQPTTRIYATWIIHNDIK